MMNKIISTPIKVIKIDDKNSIRICKTFRENDSDVKGDIRLFKLFPIDGVYDEVEKATPKGVTFDLKLLPDIINGLNDLYKDTYGKDFDPNSCK
jgi:hypothetical protein